MIGFNPKFIDFVFSPDATVLLVGLVSAVQEV